MTVDCYIVWSISDPKLFYQTLGSTSVAEQRLDALTYNELKTVMGTLAQSDIINMEDGSKRNDIYGNIASDVNALAKTYGIHVEDVKIKQFDLPESNLNAVYGRMISDAQAEAAKREAEGEQEYMRLLAEAYDSRDKQEFYEFTLALDALKSSLDGNDKTVILDGNSDLAKILMGAK